MTFLFSHLTRRQLLPFGGVVAVSALSGGVVAQITEQPALPPTQTGREPILSASESYVKVGGYDQSFLLKSADVKQIWDYSDFTQIQGDGFTPLRNALNAFEVTYQKTLLLAICLRGRAVIYALDDTMWRKYSLGTVYGQSNRGIIEKNPFYHRQTSYPNNLSTNSSLQALLQRGSSVAACHDALYGLAVQLAKSDGVSSDIFQELASHLISGAQQTPSGSSLIAIAQHLGFTYAKQ